LEEEIVANNGEITDELDVIWQSTAMAVRDKIDEYGYVINELMNREEELSERVGRAKKRIKSAIANIKRRLYNLADGKPLRGNLYSFLPYESKTRTIKSVDLLADNEKYYMIEIRGDLFNKAKLSK